MEVKVLGPDFEKLIIRPGVYIIELEFLGKQYSCTLITEHITMNRYGHRIRIQVDEKDIEYCVDRIQYSDLQSIKINNREYYMFEEILSLKEGLARITFEREAKELKYKVEDAQSHLDMHKDHFKWQQEDLDERRKAFRSVRDRFPRIEGPVEVNHIEGRNT